QVISNTVYIRIIVIRKCSGNRRSHRTDVLNGNQCYGHRIISKPDPAQLETEFTGKIVNWKELGGRDERIVILSREVNSGTHVYFKEHVLRKNNLESQDEFAPSALMLSSSQAIADEVAGNTAAIGYYGMGYISAARNRLRSRRKAMESTSCL
ncbi:MAG TPA: substrate-binding domain-containing protein, partial [Candidatus Omnitrophota bacterium]|nr:substrate-binding domain-containing protein [Candidatus Omnitrophota bacterium]